MSETILDHAPPRVSAPVLAGACCTNDQASLLAASRELWDRGDAKSALRLLDSAPPSTQAAPDGLVTYALTRASLESSLGRPIAAGATVSLLTSRHALTPSERMIADVITAELVRSHVPPQRALRHAESALEVLDDAGQLQIPDILGLTSVDALHSRAVVSLAMSLWLIGGGEAAVSTLRSSLQDHPATADVLGLYAAICATHGAVKGAQWAAVTAFTNHRIRNSSPLASVGRPLLGLAMARLHRLAYNLDFAQWCLNDAKPLRRPQNAAFAIMYSTECALLDYERGHCDDGLRELERFRSEYHPVPPPHLAHDMDKAELRMLSGTHERRTDIGSLRHLSDRELAVLRCLPSSLSNTQIAAHLYVSSNTLKTHLRHIYRCFGVSGRREAVARGIELGLL